MTQAIARDLGGQALAVLLVETGDDGETTIVVKGVHGDPGYAVGDHLPSGHGRLAEVVGSGRPMLWTDPSEAVVPLRAGGTLIGLLHERGGTSGSIDRERLLLLGRLADQIALVVQAARLRDRQEETLHRLRELDEMKSDFVIGVGSAFRISLPVAPGDPTPAPLSAASRAD